MQIHRICFAIVLIILLSLSGNADGQITYTARFTKLLEKSHLVFNTPVEQWLRIRTLRRDQFMKYDLVLVNDANDFELRTRIRPCKTQHPESFPHIEANRLAMSIATNDPGVDLKVLIPDPDIVENAFHADWCQLTYFSPKPEFSDKKYGVLLSFFAESKASVDLIILYREPSQDPVDKLPMLMHFEGGSAF